MAITSYSTDHRPGLTTYQRLAVVPSGTTPALAACIVAPKMLLNRAGKETIPGETFNVAGQLLRFKRFIGSTATNLDLTAFEVDSDSVAVHGASLEAALASFTNGFKLVSLAEPNVIKISSGQVSGGSLNAAFYGRPVTVGDIVYATGISGGTTFKRRVIGLRGVVGDGTFGANTAGNDSLAGNSSSNPITTTSSAAQVSAPADWTVGCGTPSAFNGLARGARYLTQYGEQFVITVNTPGTAGVRQVETATVAGTIGASGAGNATVIVTSSGMSGSPITLSVAVANNDTAAQVATKIRAALNGNSTIAARFIVGGTSAAVSLTRIAPVANDGTLNISVDNGTCSGLTPALSSADTTAGVANVATVNIASASGLFNATNVPTVSVAGAHVVTDANAGGELAGVDITLTPPNSGDSLTAGMAFRITVLGDYTRLTTGQVVPSGTYTGVKDTIYMVRVTLTNTVAGSLTGAKVSITDTAGIDTAGADVTITDDTNIDLGSFGLSIKLKANGSGTAAVRVGDIFFVRAIAGVVSTSLFDKVVLDGPAVDTLVFDDVADDVYTVAFRLPFTGAIAADDASGGVAWTADDTNVTISASLDTFVATRSAGNEWCPFATAVGQLQASYRAFYSVDDNNEMVPIALAEDITAYAGSVDMDNDLGFAAQEAFRGSKGELIYILNTGGRSAAAFAAALSTIENSNEISYLGVITDDAAVRAALATHIDSASSSTVRNVRRGYCGIASPGKYLVLSKKADNTNFTATVSPSGDGFLLVTVVAGASEVVFGDLGLVAGDLVELDGAEYPLASVVSDSELLLSQGPDTQINPAVTLRVFKADTVASQASWLLEQAASLANRRISLCWTERGTNIVDGVSTVIPSRFGAAFVAGLRSYLAPSVGMTRQAVSTYVRTPRMYSRYRVSDLDAIAAGGIMIIGQESKTGSVRIRHQLTTDVDHGILYWEDNIGVRLDALQLETDAVLDDVIGKVNTTEEAVGQIRARLIEMLEAKRKVAIGATAGPLIDGYNNLVVAINLALADRIEVSYNVAIGPPLNTIVQTINAFTTLP